MYQRLSGVIKTNDIKFTKMQHIAAPGTMSVAVFAAFLVPNQPSTTPILVRM